tara:strand:+ start:410 stop:859 length:450 start_codon:yes stop_codon:yes gene_type:complete
MRISNIQSYLGGADNIIAREISEGNQFLLSIEDGTIDFSAAATTFDIKADLFEANVTRKRGSITIDSLTAVGSATQHTYTKAESVFNTTVAGKFELLVPSTILSDQGSFTSTPDDTSPYIVVMKVQWAAGTPEVKNSIRFVFVIRYQPQ